MSWKYNPFTSKLDATKSKSALDAEYLRLDTANDPLTEELRINPVSTDNALIIKNGKKLIFDGA